MDQLQTDPEYGAFHPLGVNQLQTDPEYDTFHLLD